MIIKIRLVYGIDVKNVERRRKEMPRKNAIVVNFKNSVPTPKTTDFFKVLFGYFLHNLNLWVDEFDKVYILDADWNFTKKEKDALAKATNDKGVIMETNPNTPYMQAFKEVLPKIVEDKVLFLHDDTIIYKKGFVKKIFDDLEKYDIVSAFELIGTLTDKINKKWPAMNGYSNFASCLFGFKLDVLRSLEDFEDEAIYQYEAGTYIPELNYTTVDGDWMETLGRVSIRLLGKGANVLQIKQDKSNLFFQTEIKGEKNSVPEWHHLRGGIGPGRMLTNKHYGWPKQYKDDCSDYIISENLRKFAWYWFANQNPYFNIKEKYIWEVLKDLGVDKDSWFAYLEEFKKFHSL